MTVIPHGVLSERFQSALRGRRVVTGVFFTFTFDPGFFEQEILPVFLDLSLSHDRTVRIVQMEDALRGRDGDFAVYYDASGLVAGGESAKLNVDRVRVLWPTGIFHAKNVLLVVEEEPGEDGTAGARALLVASLSANLTRAGWWENVEVCQIEELAERGKTSLRGDLLKLLLQARNAAIREGVHPALEAVRGFVMGCEERPLASFGGVAYPRLYTGKERDGSARLGVVDFLENHVRCPRGVLLEVISPYFDAADVTPLRDLVAAFEPREVRVLLPRDAAGKAECSEAVFSAASAIRGVRWASLPAGFLASGKAANAAPRRVHAKVYRFFHPAERYEAIFAGSVNLTSPAFGKGGNFESGILLQLVPPQRPDWWLEVDDRQPAEFLERHEADEATSGPGAALAVRYDWAAGSAGVFWDAPGPSPALQLSAQGVPLFSLEPLPPREWVSLSADPVAALARVLTSTSLLMVGTEGAPPATVLVQESGMARKPSILLNLTAADILRCWSLLTREQRTSLLEDRAAELLGLDPALSAAAVAPLAEPESVFSRFAGIFHAFGSLERRVLAALAEGRANEVEYLVFGRKYDSLHRLLDRVLTEEGGFAPVQRYVILLCAKQLLQRLESAAAEFVKEQGAGMRELLARLEAIPAARAALAIEPADERERFLGWFEPWFLRRAEPIPEPSE